MNELDLVTRDAFRGGLLEVLGQPPGGAATSVAELDSLDRLMIACYIEDSARALLEAREHFELVTLEDCYEVYLQLVYARVGR